MFLVNPFIFSDGQKGNEEGRERMLNKHEANYFETNVENILAHYLEKAI
jgi:hypothetical protein